MFERLTLSWAGDNRVGGMSVTEAHVSRDLNKLNSVIRRGCFEVKVICSKYK